MAANSELVDVKCMMCLTEVLSLPDVRKLPCEHISCLSCLKENQKIYTTTRCPECRVEHGILEFDDLELVCQQQKQKTAQFQCGARTCKSEAVCYCSLCKTLFCKLHESNHKDMMPESHETMNMLIYKNEMEKYSPVLCDGHDESPVTVACNVCFQLLCDKCDQNQVCPRNNGGLHALKSTSHLANTLKLEFRDKFTKLTKLEESMIGRLKEILQNFDEIREEDKKLNGDIIEAVTSMQQQLAVQQEQLKISVNDHEQGLSAHVQAITNQTTEFHRDCTGAQKRTTKFLSGNDAAVIKAHGLYKSDVDELLQTEVPILAAVTKRLKVKDMPITIENVGIPDDFELSMTLPMPGPCGNLCHSESGEVISCYSSTFFGLEFQPNVSGTVVSMVIFREGLFVLTIHSVYQFRRTDYTTRLYRICLKNPVNVTELVQRGENNSYGTIDVCRTHALIVNPNTKLIMIYAFHADQSGAGNYCSIYLHERTSANTQLSAKFSSEDSVVVADTKRNLVYCVSFTYKVQWSCSKMNSPTGLAVDPNGQFIMVSEQNGHAIHLLTMNGEYVKRMDLPECTSGIPAISLYKNESVAVSCQDNKIRKYKFVY